MALSIHCLLRGYVIRVSKQNECVSRVEERQKAGDRTRALEGRRARERAERARAKEREGRCTKGGARAKRRERGSRSSRQFEIDSPFDIILGSNRSTLASRPRLIIISERPVVGMNENLNNRSKMIHLNYGNVEVGKTAVRTIEIWNESCREVIYQAQRDPTTNPLDHVFHLRSYTWVLAPREKYACQIRYRPHLVSTKHVDYFSITDSIGTCNMKITVSGSSVGPAVECSATMIIMCCTTRKPVVKRRIKLTNSSKVTATFMFSVDEKHQLFRLDTKDGTIEPSSYRYITITFAPPEDGTYTCQLPLLILHHEPVMIELYGCCSAASRKEDTNRFTYPRRAMPSFKSYMSDSAHIAGDPPPISLSRNCFNFGQADVDMEKVIERISHAICLTNHSQSNLVVSWEKDIDGIFNVTPCAMHIRAGQSVLFELSFNPCVKSSLFGRELVGSIFLDDNKPPAFPFVTSIRMIGHSFPVVSSGWIPQYEMPQTVVMPPCVPPFPVYRTFLIKRLGHLPLMFEFVPPSASHFTVKPMIGVIYQNYQIITVEMAPEPKNEQIYIERWTIYFNGNTVDECYIDFKGYAEYGNIVFWNQNTLSFAPILPCCQQFEQLGMRNVTRHRIQYRFYQMPDELKMEYPDGEIDPNDTVIQECSFQPIDANVNYDFELQCVLVVINKETTIGVKGCITLRVRGRSETGSLVAIPKDLYFGELEYNTTKTLSFDLINFSVVNIYYKLVCTHCNWPFEDIEKDVVVRPASETVFSNSHQRIMVSVTPRTPGYYEFAVEYLIRVNYRSDALLPKQCPIRVANISCVCVLPTLKVTNVCAFGSNQMYSVNISKPFLWRSMQINKLNRILENVLPGERKTLAINLFPMIINEGALYIELVVANPSTMPVSWILKRIRRCDCKPVVKRIGLSTEQQKYDCVHQSLCILHPQSGTLKAKRRTLIGIKIHYTLIGKSEVSWCMDLGHDRHIIFNVSIDCLSKSERQYSFLNIARINFGTIYFGNKQATHKTYWIHNVTGNDLPFSVGTDDISKLNKAYCCEVFSCLTQSGIVKAETAKPLLLRFQPRMFGAYKARLPITLGDKKMELTVEGESSCDSRSVFMGEPIPHHCACKTSMFPVYFNTDCIDIWSIPTYSFIVKMLLIYNNFHRDALAYEWKCEEVREILRVEVFPRKGIMNPNSVQSFRVKIFSKGQPCRIDVNIPCEFFNASERRDYQRSIIKYDILSKELEGQFTITEKGTSVPKPWIKILNKPELFCKPLSLRCSIYPVEDERSKVTLTQELKAAPTSAVYLDDSKNSCVIQDENELSVATFILEGLLWDCVNSRRFKKTLRETLIPRRNLYYSQFMMDLQERRRLIRRSFIVPPFTYIASILEEMLFIIVHQEFSLEITHLIPDDDARHINYLKTIPKQNKLSLRLGNYDPFYDMLVNEARVRPRKYARSLSKVSFAD